MDFFVRDLRE